MGEHLVEQIARAVTVHGGNLNRLAEAEVIELIELHRRLADSVTLVDAEHDRLARFLEHLRNIHICRDHAALAVGHKDDHGGGINGELCLTAHLGEDDIVALRLNTARVDHKRGLAAPFGLAVDAVAGNTGGVVHDRQPLSD